MYARMHILYIYIYIYITYCTCMHACIQLGTCMPIINASHPALAIL